jgi:hypothetical protein
MPVAKSFRSAGGVQRVGEQQQAIAGKRIGCQHRRGSSTHRPPAENDAVRSDLAAGVRRDSDDAFLQARHRVRTTGSFFPVREVETNDVEAALAQPFGHRQHAVVGHVAAGAMGADIERAGWRFQGGLENCRDVVVGTHLDPPVHTGVAQCHGRAIVSIVIFNDPACPGRPRSASASGHRPAP